MKIIITTFKNPDLDGFACTLAYTEFLQQQDKDVTPAIFGSLDPETKWVLKKLQLKRPWFRSTRQDQIILVDASRLNALPRTIKPEQVIEIIDHRKIHETEQFPNAKTQIELVGAAATLIAEKFIHAKMNPSPESATLLYGAIMSNTLNLQSKVTTQRDRSTAKWLKKQYKIPDQFVMDMFLGKSNVSGRKLITRLRKDASWAQNGDYKIGIVQIEFLGATQIAYKRSAEIIHLLHSLQSEHETDYSFASLIDLSNNTTLFLTNDSSLQRILTTVFSVAFEHNVATYPTFILRKEIGPKLHEYFLTQKNG